MLLPIANAVLPKPASRGSFGFQRTPTHRHNGIDLPAQRGTPVLSVAAGVVEHANDRWVRGFTGYGRVVVVRHADQTRALYAHLQSVHVARGDSVAAGEPIGTVGSSAFTEEGQHVDENLGTHLHFEISPRPFPQPSEASRLDPVAWLRDGSRIAADPFPASEGKTAVQPVQLSYSLRSLSCPHCGRSVDLEVGGSGVLVRA